MANEFQHKSVGTELTQAEYEAVGGHEFASQAQGDIVYASSATQLSRLGIGSAGAPLVTNDAADAPVWSTRVLHTANAFAFQEATAISTSAGNLSIDAAAGSAIRLNDAQANVDVVIESDAGDNLFHANAGTNSIGIGGAGQSTVVVDMNGTYDWTGENGDVQALWVRATQKIHLGRQGYGLRISPSFTTSSGAGVHTRIMAVYMTGTAITADVGTVTNTAMLHIATAMSGTITGTHYGIWSAVTTRLDSSLWVEGSPTEGTAGEQLQSGGAGAVMVWAAAASRREWKNVMAQYLQPHDALDRILGTQVYPFTYKDGYGTHDYDTEYLGVLADEAPWAMHHNGGVFNPVSAFGHTVLAFQAVETSLQKLARENVELVAEVDRLRQLVEV